MLAKSLLVKAVMVSVYILIVSCEIDVAMEPVGRPAIQLVKLQLYGFWCGWSSPH